MSNFIHPANDGRQEYIVVNPFEEIVKEHVEKMAKTMEMCTCEKCLSDVCAIVLNQLPPSYVTTHKGALLSRAPQTSNVNQINLTVKVIHALQMVKEAPRH